MRFTVLLLTLSTLIYNVNAQEQIHTKIFLDEALIEIDTLTYAKKCAQVTTKCLEYITKTQIVYKVLPKFKFGKMEALEYDQIRQLLNKDSKSNIKENETIIIKYYDSLLNFNTLNKKHILRLKSDSIYNANHKSHRTRSPFNVKIFKRNKNKWIKAQNKCFEKNEKKYTSKIIHMYKYAENLKESYGDFNWVKDRGFFKNSFFKIQYNYYLLILKPDGNYFLNGGRLTDKQIEELLETKDWSGFKDDLNEAETSLIINGKGIFKKNSPFNSRNKKLNHCF